MIAPDLPADCDPSKPCSAKWNQDRVWFSTGEARQWLGKAARWIDERSRPAPGTSTGAPISWEWRLELQLLRREAEALLAGH